MSTWVFAKIFTLSIAPAGPDGSFVFTGACNMKVPGLDPGRGCANTVLQTVQRCGVYSVSYITLHYDEPLKSFEIRVGNSPGFRASFCRDIASMCRKQRKAIFCKFTFNCPKN